jgi:hypothetical protein
MNNSKILAGTFLFGAFLLTGVSSLFAEPPAAKAEFCNTPSSPNFGLASRSEAGSKVDTLLLSEATRVKLDFIPLEERADRATRGYPCVLSPEGVFGVEAHGTRKVLFTRDGEILTVEDVAELILSDSRYERGMTVYLFCCETGKGLRPFAQKLANVLGAEVVAPTEKLWPQRSGRFIVAQELTRRGFFGEIGLKRADTARMGAMKTFSPDSNASPAAVAAVSAEESPEDLTSSSAATLARTKNPPAKKQKPLLRANARSAALLAGIPDRSVQYYNATERK